LNGFETGSCGGKLGGSDDGVVGGFAGAGEAGDKLGGGAGGSGEGGWGEGGGSKGGGSKGGSGQGGVVGGVEGEASGGGA